jgi:hemerythrin-like domain-containing protein
MSGNEFFDPTRRDFVLKSCAVVASALAASTISSAFAQEKDTKKDTETKGQEKQETGKTEEISPVEDLMREHGALSRILLIYDNQIAAIDQGKEANLAVVNSAAAIVRKFIEQYHEKLEEDFIFPRFEKAGRLADLTKILKQQHEAGRKLTDEILKLTAPAAAKEEQSQKLAIQMRLFIRMYRPHKAREDTVLFPALHTVVSPQEFDSLGEKFEDKEQELFGKNGFDKIVAEVADLEKKLGLYDLQN